MGLLQKWIRSNIEIDSEFLNSTDDECILYSKLYKQSIMHEWERPIMKEDAKLVTSLGGNVLNVGHGMGIIDGYIKDSNIEEHTIVEIHPQIAERARNSGYSDVYEGDWIDFVDECIKSNRKFTGIYFDTFCFDGRPDWELFTKKVDSILEPGGIFVYLNGMAAKTQHVQLYLEHWGWNPITKSFKYERPYTDVVKIEDWTSIGWIKPI